MEFDAFACILKGGGGRVAPDSLKIQTVQWICMVLEGPPPRRLQNFAKPKNYYDFH